MFTGGAFLLVALIGWYAGRMNDKDRPNYESGEKVDQLWLLALHIRQDLKPLLLAWVA